MSVQLCAKIRCLHSSPLPAVRTAALRSLSSLLTMIDDFSASDISIFPQYIFPALSRFSSDPHEMVRYTAKNSNAMNPHFEGDEVQAQTILLEMSAFLSCRLRLAHNHTGRQVRIAFARCLPRLAENSRRFLDIAHAKQMEGSFLERNAEGSRRKRTNTKSGNMKENFSIESYDKELTHLQEASWLVHASRFIVIFRHHEPAQNSEVERQMRETEGVELFGGILSLTGSMRAGDIEILGPFGCSRSAQLLFVGQASALDGYHTPVHILREVRSRSWTVFVAICASLLDTQNLFGNFGGCAEKERWTSCFLNSLPF